MKPIESEEKLNEYWKIVYPKRIIERILCQIVDRFTRKYLAEEKATSLVENEDFPLWGRLSENSDNLI